MSAGQEPRLILTARDPQERLLYIILAIIAVLLAVYLIGTAWSVLAG